MCTAVSFKGKGAFFGRTLDMEKCFGEEIVISPCGAPLLRGGEGHYAVAGMAVVADGLPLYYDAINERGLCMAGLNFPHSTRYSERLPNRVNLAQHEFLSYILGTCSSADEAERALKDINITAEDFSPRLKSAPLHWMISDKSRDIVVECTPGGMRVYDNAVGVLTNEPSFEMQLFNLNNYMGVTASPPRNAFAEGVELSPYCFGMGGLGLPGDWSSQSRFVRAAFVRNNYRPSEGERGENCLYAVLQSVCVPRGCCSSGVGWDVTLYASCMDMRSKTYGCRTRLDCAPITAGFVGAGGDELIRLPVKL